MQVDRNALKSHSLPGNDFSSTLAGSFHLGDANDATKDFSFGLPAIEGTFAKSGQIVGHNNVHDGKVVQLERDDSGWETVDLPYDRPAIHSNCITQRL
jgi:hypothetical protein